VRRIRLLERAWAISVVSLFALGSLLLLAAAMVGGYVPAYDGGSIALGYHDLVRPVEPLVGYTLLVLWLSLLPLVVSVVVLSGCVFLRHGSLHLSAVFLPGDPRGYSAAQTALKLASWCFAVLALLVVLRGIL
jgi:hypothetical protein